tara:strand:- start:282 stop:761 length:480 start_codon:yes stop_codon:yes gene_type:complete
MKGETQQPKPSEGESMETSQMNTRDTVVLSEGQRHELNRLEELQLIYDEFDMDLDAEAYEQLRWLRDQRELANEDAKAALLLHCIEALAASPGWSFQTIAEHISGPIAMVSALQGVPLRFEHEEWAWPTSTEGERATAWLLAHISEEEAIRNHEMEFAK